MNPWQAVQQGFARLFALGLDLANGLVLYLPVLLMGLLAFLTYGLLRNTPSAEPDRPDVAPRHEPDYTMERVVMQQYKADGLTHARLQAQSLRHYPDTNTLHFEKPVLIWHSDKAGATRAQAMQGQTNADGSEVVLSGAVRVQREATPQRGKPLSDDWVMRTEYLFIDARRERMHSDQAVQVQRGGDQIQGQRMQYDHAKQQLDMSGRVKVLLTPKRLR
ncbi:MAG: LPS export ABC transporter periplasmic protein LptC [Betaproteobacteria bacterium]|nr:LPS export ABC transporter periplasmic protein LptC [Betaproteobacteria bacterium]